MNNQQILNIIESQRNFFQSGQTKCITFRIKQLKKLLTLIEQNETRLLEALKKDLGRHEFDGFLGDIAPLKKSIQYHINNVKKWVKPKKVKSMMPFTKSFIYSEPLGDVLIIGAWNYPLLILLDPLVGAISAGNCATLKPSEIATNTSNIICEIINNNFESEYLNVIEGGIEETTFLLEQNFDHIFFTGSTNIGKIVYEAAAKSFSPVTLELGGKSPIIFDKSADLKIGARRIIWGKLFNNGQTCTAPDYLFVDNEIKQALTKELINAIIDFYGENAQTSEFYSRIINQKNFERLSEYLKDGNILYGGKTDKNNLYIEPTLIENISPTHKIMQEEIFGPILPIISYNNIKEVINFINSRPKPLALYVFSKDSKFCNYVINNTSAGGMSINDTIMHITSDNMPFGGVGESGFGKYHGKWSFDTFSNQKSIFKNNFIIDRNILYPPYKTGFNVLKRITKLF